MQYLTTIDLNKNELQNAVIHPLATAPSNPVKYQIYTNSTDSIVYQYNGTAWKPIGVLYSQDSSTGVVITGLDTEGNVTTTNVIALTLTGYTPVEDGYVTTNMTMQQAIAALDEAVKNAVAGGGEVNQNAWSNIDVAVASTATTDAPTESSAATISATAKTDTFSVAPSNKWVGVSADTTNKIVKIGHATSGVTAGDYGSATAVPAITVDAAGHVTSAEAKTIVGAEYITGLTSDAQTQIDAKIPNTEKGVANGVATLDANGLVPSGQLPSYVDDVIDAYVVAGSTALSAGWLSDTDGGTALTPETGKIYIVLSAGEYLNKQYRWSGSTYVECSPSDVNSVNGKTGIVVLTLDDIGTGTTNVPFTTTLKTKLDGIEEGATADTITLNGTATQTPTFFAPVDGGTAGQVLMSNGNAAPTWQAAPESVHKYTATNPVLTASGGAFTWTIGSTVHGIDNTSPIVQVYEVSTKSMVIADIEVYDDKSIAIIINDAESTGTLAAGSYKVVAIG